MQFNINTIYFYCSRTCFLVFLIFLLSIFLFNRLLLALKDTSENIPIEDEVAQKQSVPEINSELHDKKDLNACLVPLAERSSETKAGPGIPERQPPSRPKVATQAVISPLTLFLLGTDTVHTYDPVYEKKLQGKRKRWFNKALKMGRRPYVCFK